jgi:Glucose / Sorbosone dehydrogenase
VSRPFAATLALALLLLVAGPAQAAPRLEKVGDFDQPAYAVGAPGDYSRLYVVERTGTVRVVRGGRVSPTPFLTLSDASSSGERGLLSIAFSPDFQTSRLVYAYYTRGNGNVRVDQFRATSPDGVDAGSERQVIELAHQAAPNHNGGTVAFGPDGYLWLAPGDGGSGQSGNAQNLGSLLGKMLRIRPRAGGGYSIPGDNPFVGRAGLDEIWAYGLRNPFRFSFDRLSGDLVIGDVGQNATEEIDFARASGGRAKGANFGWYPCEGSFVQGTMNACTFGTLPVIDQSHDNGWFAIIGGVVVRDPSLPSLYGRYLYGDNSQPVLHAATMALPRARDSVTALRVPQLAGISEDTAGCVYASALSGAVYRVVENATGAPCPRRSLPATADRLPPRLSVRVPSRQRVRKQHGTIAYARSSEAGKVAMSGRLRIGRRSYKLPKTTNRAAAHRRITLRLRLTKRASRALRRALRQRRRARIDVALRSTDAAGNRGILIRRRVRVRR